MREPFLRPFSGNDPTKESWINRVRENLGQLLIPSHFKPSPANGAPIHLLKFDKSLRPARAQGASFLTHAAVFAVILLLLTNTKVVQKPPFPGGTTPLGPYTPSASLIRTLTSDHPTEGSGRSGDQNPTPATRGNLPPLSSIVL